MFTYSPKNSDSKVDCYVSYEFREDGNILKSIDKEFYKNISTEHPIVLEFPRKKASLYELKVNIKDKSGINLYKTNIEINPATIDNKTSNLIKKLKLIYFFFFFFFFFTMSIEMKSIAKEASTAKAIICCML